MGAVMHPGSAAFPLSLGFSMAWSSPLLLLLVPPWLWELDEGPTTCSSPSSPLTLLALWPHPGALPDPDAGSFTVENGKNTITIPINTLNFAALAQADRIVFEFTNSSDGETPNAYEFYLDNMVSAE